MPRNIFAFTEPGSNFPGFASLNDVDGKLLLTARSAGDGGRNIGCVELPNEELAKLHHAVGLELARRSVA